MKNYVLYVLSLAFLFVGSSCSDDGEDTTPIEFVVAFQNPSLSFDTVDTEKEVNLVFSTTAPEDGTVTISYTTVNAEYSTDFTTAPAGTSGELTVSFTGGSTGTSFTFNKLLDAIEGTTKTVNFTIAAISVVDATIQGNTQLAVSFTETAAPEGTTAPEVGGPNQDDQVYVDLSSITETTAKRDSWDLGFYNGEAFRVTINGSIFMAVSALESTDIDAVTPTDVEALQPQVAVGTFDAANIAFVDHVTGSLEGTAIAAISETDADNPVYLVNLGFEVGTEEPEVGAVAVSGDPRGWKKIRILRNGDDYVLQYADLDATTHEEVTISKTSGYHFTFFSFDTEETVDVQPAADRWDINFTVFTNEIEGFGSYGYSDFITTNILSSVSAYQVETATTAYADFGLADVDEALFLDDQRGIGSNWRNGGGPGMLPSLKDDVFFVLKDTDGNIYKIRFTALTNESGVRGYPAFEFALL
ncbi:HmuY family protein [Muricauda sp. CAU 1633]|uniref:HmuY family protein n=1 Tax=Allomuricauda sp. CAU 1633 TaxID=2816036 RepID=UPI001A8C7D31|nr:HmuY family protein [Muricauda sp. CAU 1633]MBO0321597.1 HmuY family protein [Muricauda sp. CAU 1633]